MTATSPEESPEDMPYERLTAEFMRRTMRGLNATIAAMGDSPKQNEAGSPAASETEDEPYYYVNESDGRVDSLSEAISALRVLQEVEAPRKYIIGLGAQIWFAATAVCMRIATGRPASTETAKILRRYRMAVDGVSQEKSFPQT